LVRAIAFFRITTRWRRVYYGNDSGSVGSFKQYLQFAVNGIPRFGGFPHRLKIFFELSAFRQEANFVGTAL
jgi:hypothetical protein